jgi:kynurenine formamidase
MLTRETATSRCWPALGAVAGLLLTACAPQVPPPAATTSAAPALWQTYDQALKGARHIDLTHTLTPSIPVWPGFGVSTFGPVVNLETGKPCTFADDGFEATRYVLATDQFGTQLDPPVHWAPEYPAIDELPPTYAIRPLVVISIVDQVVADPGYHLQVADIERWETAHGRIPEGSGVMVRSDWSKDWPDPALATRRPFPGDAGPEMSGRALRRECRIVARVPVAP